MDPELKEQLRFCQSLPSPPSIAVQLLDMCEKPDFDLDALCRLIEHDPVLTARLLRASNSPLYGYRRPAKTLKDALLFLGVNAAISLALTFTLTLPLARASRMSASYTRIWQRSGLASLVAAETAKHLELPDLEQLFLTALLQDIGMFALIKVFPERYSDLLDSCSQHAQLAALETEQFGDNHVRVGAWLLEEWKLPSPIAEHVALSHAAIDESGRLPREVGCLAFSWRVADYISQGSGHPERLQDIHAWADALFDAPNEVMADVLASVQERVPELNRLFDAGVLTNDAMRESMLERARELLLLRNLDLLQNAERMEARFQDLENRAQTLEARSHVDPLTGLHARTDLDSALQTAFEETRTRKAPLSLLMIDLDHLKELNDAHGHIAGDEALRRIGHSILDNIRGADFAARYGGDEFVVILKDTEAAEAQRIAERIHSAAQREPLQTLEGHVIGITTSLGLATQGQEQPYEGPWALVHAADRALYEAKERGRNRVAYAQPAQRS